MGAATPGRFKAVRDEGFVVFLIGFRINRFRAVRKWLPTALAMGPMLETLFKHPEKGFLGAETLVYWRGVAVVQYWRSKEDLFQFAHDSNDPHLAAWRHFNRTIGTDGTVGIWHETYVVEAGQYETLYNNMPAFGLAAATTRVTAATYDHHQPPPGGADRATAAALAG